MSEYQWWYVICVFCFFLQVSSWSALTVRLLEVHWAMCYVLIVLRRITNNSKEHQLQLYGCWMFWGTLIHCRSVFVYQESRCIACGQKNLRWNTAALNFILSLVTASSLALGCSWEHALKLWHRQYHWEQYPGCTWETSTMPCRRRSQKEVPYEAGPQRREALQRIYEGVRVQPGFSN